MIETSRTCERSFLQGIAKYSALLGPWTVYKKPQFYLKSRRIHSLSLLQEWGVQGIIACDTDIDKEMLDSGIPVISLAVKHKISGVVNVIGDVIKPSQMAAEYLLQCGLRNFAFCGIGKFYWSEGRMEHFRDRIKKAGFETHLFIEPESLYYSTWEKTQVALSKWLCGLPKPIGIMTCADDCSQHVVEACKINNIKIPEEISIIGVDNDDMVCLFSNPTLSSIALNFGRAGYEAASVLDKMMKGQKTTKQDIMVYTDRVVERQSTNILTIDNKEVVKALHFMRDNAKFPIQVADVVNAASFSRRNLEMKFMKYCGCSINSKIQHYRIMLICQMLTKTDMTISQIALEVGFANISHLSRYFHKSMKISPSDYRKKHSLTTFSP
jgi:LacI family transcriptional regulator